MSSQHQQPQPQPHQRKPPPAKKEKRPQLTHFLCLPLINSTSLPQLESSLAAFKSELSTTTTTPPPPPPHQAQHHDQPAKPQPLIPDAAIRPVGTLHLTLGVMSLPSKERLDSAINLLQSLDLVSLMRQAETIARARAQGRADSTRRAHSRGETVATETETETETETPGRPDRPDDGLHEPVTEEDSPRPFTISLESLHALPRARSATVLHATPVDSTSRLYPFCELLRDRFLDAGFLQGEVKKDDASQQQQQQQQPQEQQNEGEAHATNPSQTFPQESDNITPQSQHLATAQPSLLEEMPIEVAEDVAENPPNTPVQRTPLTPTPKPRPLLLHATIVNTIYIKGRSRDAGGVKKRKNNRYSFDARDLLARYRDYYLDRDRTIPRGDTERAVQREDEDLGGADTSTPNPFVWARDFPIEAVCICEMGAKKLDPEADEDGLNARLREKYMVVAQRSLGL